jgi:hypothetical protein
MIQYPTPEAATMATSKIAVSLAFPVKWGASHCELCVVMEITVTIVHGSSGFSEMRKRISTPI